MESAPFTLMLNTLKWPLSWGVLSKQIVKWRSSVKTSMPFIMKDALGGVTWFSQCCIECAFLKNTACCGTHFQSLFRRLNFCCLWYGEAYLWPDVGLLSCVTALNLHYSSCVNDDAFPLLFIFFTDVLWLGVFQVAQNYLLWVNYPQTDA